MVQNNTTGDLGKTSASADAHDAMSRLKTETSAAREAAREGRTALEDTVGSLSSRARNEAEARGETAKEQAAEGLHSFADAIRSASDDLAKKQPGVVSDLVGQAAGGLEGLSRALHSRSAGQMVDDIREFGRQNPAGFMAASILAGLALGRFAGSSATHRHSGERPAGYRPPESPAAANRSAQRQTTDYLSPSPPTSSMASGSTAAQRPGMGDKS